MSVLADLESNDELHAARLLLLLKAFDTSASGRIEGITKLAKLDFLLRYPVFLERALKVRHMSPAKVRVQDHERNSVESRMVRYRFGPWDHRYRRFVNLLVAKGLAQVTIEGRTVNISLTDKGRDAAARLASDTRNEDIVRRTSLLKKAFDMGAAQLVKFIYSTFPEVVSLSSDQVIDR